MKGLDFYLALNYPINLIPINKEDGGGWLSEIPVLKGCMSDGETQQEAILNLQDAKLEWLKTALKRGQNIPIPQNNEIVEYSGKLTLRMPKTLHHQLASVANDENVSLNQYILSLISYNFGQKVTERKVEKESTPVHNTFIFHDMSNDLLFDKPNKKYGKVYNAEFGDLGWKNHKQNKGMELIKC